MKKELVFKNHKGMLPFNIQLFAEDGKPDGEGTNPTPKTYTQEEYDKLLQEVNKQKAEKDKAAKEAADFKKQIQASLTDEEKRKEAEAEKDKKLATMESELQNYKLTAILSADGTFSAEEITKILEKKEDLPTVFQTIVGLVKTKCDESYKKGKTEFMQSSDVDGQGGGQGESLAMKKAKEASKSTEEKVGWGAF